MGLIGSIGFGVLVQALALDRFPGDHGMHSGIVFRAYGVYGEGLGCRLEGNRDREIER